MGSMREKQFHTTFNIFYKGTAVYVDADQDSTPTPNLKLWISSALVFFIINNMQWHYSVHQPVNIANNLF